MTCEALRRNWPLRSAWPIGPATHLWVVKASSYVHACMAMDSPLVAIFIALLLSKTSDLHVCPQTLAIVSACSRSSTLIRALVFLCWCKRCFHSPAVEHLTVMEGVRQKKKKSTDVKLRKQWLLWYILMMVLSTPAILYQVAKSIPGSLQIGKILSLGLKAGIGATQGLVGNFIVPYLASKMTGPKHIFTTIASFLINCLIPAVVIIYLDIGCLGRWVSLWKPCRSNRQLFQRHLTNIPGKEKDLAPEVAQIEGMKIDTTLVHPSDICDPHVSWTFYSMSKCVHITLLRLQEIWLTKLITIGLTMPGLALMCGKLPTESGAVVGTSGIYMAFALVSSGHLPLMNFILHLAFLGEGLLARVAWAEKSFKAKYVADVTAPVVKMARLLSLMVHLASAAGDPHMLLLASAYIFMLIMVNSTDMRLAAGWRSRIRR